ncbi:MAG: hypothetical protein ACYDBJ_10080 [Aggregatilineales bacterium]
MSAPEFTKAGLTQLLLGLGYDPADADGMVAELLAIQSPIRDAFMRWWQNGQTSQLPAMPTYEGYTPASLAAQYNLRPVAAFLTLDWLATEPDVARKALSEGYDEILT